MICSHSIKQQRGFIDVELMDKLFGYKERVAEIDDEVQFIERRVGRGRSCMGGIDLDDDDDEDMQYRYSTFYTLLFF